MTVYGPAQVEERSRGTGQIRPHFLERDEYSREDVITEERKPIRTVFVSYCHIDRETFGKTTGKRLVSSSLLDYIQDPQDTIWDREAFEEAGNDLMRDGESSKGNKIAIPPTEVLEDHDMEQHPSGPRDWSQAESLSITETADLEEKAPSTVSHSPVVAYIWMAAAMLAAATGFVILEFLQGIDRSIAYLLLIVGSFTYLMAAPFVLWPRLFSRSPSRSLVKDE